MKEFKFRGSARAGLREFPKAVRQDVGFQLDRVQNGRNPSDWKPMPAIGQGVQEIRIRGDAGTFRAIHVARFTSVVYVLHCFQKKSEKTSRADLDLATKRYQDLLKELQP
ncbi:MAG: type II toxin-antitoxin system RelE/ParE family toxin [Burkholderiaceae bacterium]|nr:type II toxin-antitoxin system RelE/ParE family toxin [Burkholderiaceae bacterium]